MGLRVVYSAITLVASIVALPLLVCRRRGRPKLWQRFGLWNVSSPATLWFHGASVGEVNGLLPLVAGLRQRFPQDKVLITCFSANGLRKAMQVADEVRLIPFDSFPWVWLALRKVKCRAFIFGETELWPELIWFLGARKVPLFLVNGVISDYTLSRYQSLRFLLKRVFPHLSFICAANDASRERFIALGADPHIIKTVGNSKYDVEPSIRTASERQELRELFFENDHPVLVLGSIHPGEDEYWLPAIKEFRKSAKLNVILAPRHAERFEYFARKLSEADLPFRRWSQLQSAEQEASDTILLDGLGQLEAVYSLASLAFIGGTLVDIGGHNPLEAAAYSVGIVVGPQHRKIAPIVEDLKSSGGLEVLRTKDDVVRVLQLLSADQGRLTEMGEAAQRVWQSHQGAGQRIVEVIEYTLRSAESGGKDAPLLAGSEPDQQKKALRAS